MAYRNSNSDQVLELLGRFSSGSVTRSTVAADDESVEVVAANAERIGLSVYNDGDTTLYLAYGADDATLTDFSVAVPTGALYEAPTGWASLAVQGIWAGSPTGNAMITEVV